MKTPGMETRWKFCNDFKTEYQEDGDSTDKVDEEKEAEDYDEEAYAKAILNKVTIKFYLKSNCFSTIKTKAETIKEA